MTLFQLHTEFHTGTFLALLIFMFVFIDFLLYLRVPHSVRRKYSFFQEAIPGSGIWIYFKHRKEQDNGS